MGTKNCRVRFGQLYVVGTSFQHRDQRAHGALINREGLNSHRHTTNSQPDHQNRGFRVWRTKLRRIQRRTAHVMGILATDIAFGRRSLLPVGVVQRQHATHLWRRRSSFPCAQTAASSKTSLVGGRRIPIASKTPLLTPSVTTRNITNRSCCTIKAKPTFQAHIGPMYHYRKCGPRWNDLDF